MQKNKTKNYQREKDEFLGRLFSQAQSDKVLSIIQKLQTKTNQQEIDSEIDFILEQAQTFINLKQNVCFYGFGEKFQVINDFVSQNYISSHCVINIRGFEKSLSGKNIFVKILLSLKQTFPEISLDTNLLNKQTINTRLLVDQIVYIFRSQEQSYSFLIVFHNFDSQEICTEENLGHFSQLAKLKFVNFVATIESV